MPLWPVTNGYAVRVVNLLRELTPSWDIVLVAAASPRDADRTEGLGLVEYTSVPMRGNVATMPWQLDTARLREVVKDTAARWRPDLVILWSGVEFFERDLAGAVVLADRIDCATLAQIRNTRLRTGWRERFRCFKALIRAAGYERKIVRRLAGTVVVGSADASTLRRVAGRGFVHVVPNGARPGPPPDLESEAATPTVMFTGGLGFQPNLDAASAFSSEIWPLVRKEMGPSVRFVVAGRGNESHRAALESLPGVEVALNVPDMAAALAESWVVVAPMRSGGGIKNKILEAWAAGKPVVMTSLAGNGLDPKYRECALIRDDPEGFAHAVTTLLREPAERSRLGRAGYDLVRTSHSWKGAAESLTRIMQEALSRAETRQREVRPRLVGEAARADSDGSHRTPSGRSA